MSRILLPVIVIAAIAGLYATGQTGIAAGIAALLAVVMIFRQAVRSARRSH